MADIFDVIADATRRDILNLLHERSQAETGTGDRGTSVSEIVAALGLSQPTVSKHLKVLREANLVAVREEGQHRYYSLSPDPLEDIEDWLLPLLGGEAVTEDVLALAATLPQQARQVADAIGQAAAAGTHRVESAVQAVVKKLGGHKGPE
ncbi:ArsR family transcriptional regulator [Mycetocola tolaasinivorans]|uniref:ArsR family transcriptional regulator n=1 Tax=Mycetocola tolaasinivorans TaxID=76635 RepID=A0A3L7A6A2_9MICO|nr:metalloregulator ArsR/SmtB family transcription factor [Mycetocola tolaasinivorans]RLP75654.1 ArsR family transcriptional regulator [Mycetocola tolaasinivorans]